MRCRFCGEDEETLVMITSFGETWFSCEPCAHSQGLICEEHGEVHLGFLDGSHACLVCIEKMVEGYSADTKATYQILKHILPAEVWEELNVSAVVASVLSGSSVESSIMRFIATKAVRSGRSFLEVLNEVKALGSVESILENPLYGAF